MIDITIPGLRLVNSLNAREHWAAKAKRAKRERNLVTLVLRRTVADMMPMLGPLVVTVTRIGPRRLDDDGATASAKHVRDAIAALLGVDDGSDAVCWRVEQARGAPGVRVRIESRPAAEARPGAA